MLVICALASVIAIRMALRVDPAKRLEADMNGKGIRIEGLRKHYGSGDTAVDALKGVNMEVAPARWWA